MSSLQYTHGANERAVNDIINSEAYKGRALNGALLRLYLCLVPACLFVCATNGFDGSVLNGLQAGTYYASLLQLDNTAKLIAKQFHHGYQHLIIQPAQSSDSCLLPIHLAPSCQRLFQLQFLIDLVAVGLS